MSESKDEKIRKLENKVDELEKIVFSNFQKLDLLEQVVTGYINSKLHGYTTRNNLLLKYDNYIDLEKSKFYSGINGSEWVGVVNLGPNITIR